jgi:hypothetical protein
MNSLPRGLKLKFLAFRSRVVIGEPEVHPFRRLSSHTAPRLGSDSTTKRTSPASLTRSGEGPPALLCIPSRKVFTSAVSA